MTEKPEKINNDIKIYQNPGSLAFGTDAYLLSAYVRRGSKKMCELGAGSGVITLLCAAKKKFSSAVCVEIQENISHMCETNVSENGFSGKISVISSDIRELPHTMDGSFDTVITNPPYLKITSGKLNASDADTASRHELFGTVGDFCAAAARLLKFGGTFYAVYRPDRLSDLIHSCTECGLMPKMMTLVYPTVGHKPSIMLIRAKKGAKGGMTVTKPLIMYSSPDDLTDGGFTDDMKYIYENGDFNDAFR